MSHFYSKYWFFKELNQRHFFGKCRLKEKLCVKLRTGGTVILDFKNKHEVAMYFDIFSRDISRLQEKLLRPGDIFVELSVSYGGNCAF